MKRSKEHIVGDVGETSTSLELKKWGWTADHIISDYGEDLDCNIFIDNLRTQYHFRCQVKSTIKHKNYIKKLKSGNFSISINIENAKSWLLAYYPVFLIIYDESLNNHYWINASSFLKNILKKFSNQSISLQVPAQNVLSRSKQLIIEEIEKFYSDFFRIESTTLTSNIYPILMPNYLSLGIDKFKTLPKTDLFDLEPESNNIEGLPSWFGNFENLHPPYFFSFKVSSNKYNLEEYVNEIKNLLLTWDITKNEDEWISFIISPIQSEAKSTKQGGIWNRKFIDWFVLDNINGQIYFDEHLAFSLPPDFLRQVARRAMSYDYFHHVNPKDDIAIELYSAIKTPQSFKYESDIYQKQIESQFIPWKIKKEDEKIFYEQLPEGYSFARVEEVEEITGYLRGIISKPMFNPTVGTFHQIVDWKELEENSVRANILRITSEGLIVGEQDDDEVTKIINSYYEHVIKNDDQISVTERNKISGYPLNLSNRMIFVQRYRKIKSPNIEHIDNTLGDYIEKLAKYGIFNLHAAYQEVDLYGDIPIYRIFFHWNTAIKYSSAESFNSVKEIIVECFDKIFPRETDNNTYDILSFMGQLCFEEPKT